MTKCILYCHCAYAKVVKPEVKAEVLRRLGASERDFEAVPDLCEMAARKDETLEGYAARADGGDLEIVACYPRAVRWLFHGGKQKLSDDVKVHNMREDSPDAISRALGLEVQEPTP